ncbi:MAG: hypothetical protein ABIV06_05500 [Thermoanaerobaculia bacterium]
MQTHSGRPFRTGLLALVVAFSPAALCADVAGHRTVDLPLLLDLPGNLASVRYTPGSLDRAASVQARFELLTEEFSHTRFKANAVVFYVLSPEDWAAARVANPYGDPMALATDALVVPAWADGELIGRVRGWLGGPIPLPNGLPLLATREEAGALGISDLLAQIAVGRLLATRANLRGDAGWIAPVMAHLVARLAWDRFEPGRMPEIAALFDAMAAQDKNPGGHAVTAWDERLPLPKRAYFEARFLRAADLIVTAKGSRAARRILNKAIVGTQPLTEAVLFKEVPALADWLATNFPPETPAPAPTAAAPAANPPR